MFRGEATNTISKSAIFQIYQRENKVIFDHMVMMSALY